MGELVKGKNVLITGAGHNIGRSVALEMAREGANVYFTDIDRARCKSVEKELSNYNVSVKGTVSDITSESDTDTLCGWFSNERINVDILVNNVGVDTEGRARQRSLVNKVIGRIEARTKARRRLQTWRDLYDTNVFGPKYLTDRITEMMMSSGVQGSIIFTTSIHQWTIMLDAAYSSSKAALGMVIKELALTLAPHGI